MASLGITSLLENVETSSAGELAIPPNCFSVCYIVKHEVTLSFTSFLSEGANFCEYVYWHILSHEIF